MHGFALRSNKSRNIYILYAHATMGKAIQKASYRIMSPLL